MEQELTRATVDPRYTGDVTRVYESDEAWERAFAEVKEKAAALAAKAGTLSGGDGAILAVLRAVDAMNTQLSGVYCYAMMKQHEDTTVGVYQAMNSRAQTLYSEVGAKTAFLTPELLTLEVRDSNEAAIRLYDALGFTEIGRRPNYYFHPKEDARILRKDLTA